MNHQTVFGKRKHAIPMGQATNLSTIHSIQSINTGPLIPLEMSNTTSSSATTNDVSNHMVFSIPSGRSDPEKNGDPLSIKLRHATNTDDNQGENETNTGFVMWPSAVLLAHYLTQNPEIWRRNKEDDPKGGGDILEIGAGCGLVGLSAATLLQNDISSRDDKVVFTDYNPAVLENLKYNIELNNFHVEHQVLGLDWFDMINDNGSSETKKKLDNTWVDMEGTRHGQFRLILGADLLVCSNDAELVAHTIDSALIEGGQAIILGPAAGTRFGIEGFPDACRSLGMSVEVDEDIIGAIDAAGEGDSSRQQLKAALALGGHLQRSSACGHAFTLFTIEKSVPTSA